MHKICAFEGKELEIIEKRVGNMKKRLLLTVIVALVLGAAACGQKETVATNNQETVVNAEATPQAESQSATNDAAPVSENALADGVMQAKFDTDSSMFHVNEACEGMGELTVKDGQMTIHVSLTSQNIKNLYLGMAADAETDTDNWLQPTLDTVKYSDGTTEEVNGFDVPVPYLDEEFDLALIGSKGKWYDHKVKVSLVAE